MERLNDSCYTIIDERPDNRRNPMYDFLLQKQSDTIKESRGEVPNESDE